MSLFQIIAYYHEHFTNDANMRSPLRLSDVCPMFGLEMVRGSALAAWGGGGGGRELGSGPALLPTARAGPPLTGVAVCCPVSAPASSAQAGPFVRVSALASAISDHVVAEPLTEFLLIADSLPSGKYRVRVGV